MRVSPRFSLQGKKGIITGASKGIGFAIAQEFLELGAEVALIARNAEPLQEQLQRWWDQGHFGQFNFLINNVGTNIRKIAQEYTAEEYQLIFRTNLVSAFEMSRLAYPFLHPTKNASIVNIASVGGIRALRTGVVYAMTKAAMVQMSQNPAVDGGFSVFGF